MLSASQKEQLVQAFMEAFPRYDDLRYMLSTRLEENIEAALPVGSSMRNYILDLVVQMEALGRLKELLLGALKENPRNPHLLKCGIDFEAITAPESIELPELRPVLEFSAAAREALFTHKDVLVLSQPSDYYREDMLVAPSDAHRWGMTKDSLYAVLSIQPRSLDKPARQMAVHLLIDERVKSGSIHINQLFGESQGLLPYGKRSWFVCKAKRTKSLVEIIFELIVEHAKEDNEIEELRKHYQGTFVGRPLLVERTDSPRYLSLHVPGLGYLGIHALQPAIADCELDTVLYVTEKTNSKLLVPHRKSAVDMVILVDVSGSMTIKDYVGDDDLPHSRLDGVRLALETLIERCLLSGYSRVSRLAILAFGNTVAMLYPSRPVMEDLNSVEKVEYIRFALQQNLSDMGLRILKVERNPTNISAALSAAADVLHRSYLEETEKVLVLLSDGANWDERSDPDAEGEIVGASEDPAGLANSLHSHRDICIHTVAISNEEAYRRYCKKEADKVIKGLIPNIPLLQKIAASADGIFFESPDAKSLNRLFDELGQGVIYPLT